MKKTFIIDKKDISKVKLHKDPVPALKDAEVLLQVEKAAFTANNITYAVLGDRFRYWNFFPDERGGIVPVWGYASVVESNVDGVTKGTRFYGYYPLSSHLIVKPVHVNKYGMLDGMEHRKELPGVYNYYEKVIQDFEPEKEAAYMLYQPLFATSFLLEDYYRDNEWFGADVLYLTSASSKTAIAFAYLLKQNNKKVSIVGLTSEGNKSFCTDLGCYDRVLGYGQMGDIDSRSSCIIDFAGNAKVLKELQDQLLGTLKKCSTVGLSHWDKSVSEEPLPFKTELFFAPEHAKRRQAEWGGKEFKIKLDGVLFPFLDWVISWMKFTECKTEDIGNKYVDVLNGNIWPHQGLVLEF